MNELEIAEADAKLRKAQSLLDSKIAFFEEMRLAEREAYIDRQRLLDAAPLMLQALMAWKETDGTWLDEINDLYDDAKEKRDAAIKAATGVAE